LYVDTSSRGLIEADKNTLFDRCFSTKCNWNRALSKRESDKAILEIIEK
jgi:hypothetical protein